MVRPITNGGRCGRRAFYFSIGVPLLILAALVMNRRPIREVK